MEVKTLAKVEVSVLSILEKIKDNGGQTVVFSQKLVPNGELSFQVSAMRDGNNDPDHEEHTEDNEVMVKVNILILGWTHSSTIIPQKRAPNTFYYFRWREKMQYIRRFTTTTVILLSALSLTSPPSVRTVGTSFGVCLEIKATGARCKDCVS